MTNRSWLSIALVLTAFWLGTEGHATPPETCRLQGEISLDEDTPPFICFHDMKIAEGTRITTNGYPLSIIVVGNIYYPKHGLEIIAPYDIQEPPTGKIEISARTAFGVLNIKTDGPVHLEYVGTDGHYRQKIEQPPGADLQVEINGQDVI